MPRVCFSLTRIISIAVSGLPSGVPERNASSRFRSRAITSNMRSGEANIERRPASLR
jgi:hypothetical protein